MVEMILPGAVAQALSGQNTSHIEIQHRKLVMHHVYVRLPC